MLTQVRNEANNKKKRVAEANKKRDAGGSVQLQLIGVFTRGYLFCLIFFTIRTGETECWAWDTLKDGDPGAVVSLWLLTAALKLLSGNIFAWVVLLSAIISRGEGIWKVHVLLCWMSFIQWLNKSFRNLPFFVIKREIFIFLQLWHQPACLKLCILLSEAAPTGALSRRKEKHG